VERRVGGRLCSDVLRRASWLVPVAVAALAVTWWARPPRSERSSAAEPAWDPAAVRAPAASTSASSAPVAAPLPRILTHAPLEARAQLDVPIELTLDAPITAAALESSVRVTPPVRLRARIDGSRATLSPEPRWKQGRVHRLRFSGDALAAPYEIEFRTRVPAPAQVRPGGGARLIFSFDDAPRARKQADRLLDRLRELDIQALLFPTGYWVKERSDWIERARREGHRVCNHTLSHQNLTLPRYDEAHVRAEIAGGASDGECKLYRPPLMAYDARVERIVKELGLELFLWDIDSRDWQGLPAEDLVHLVLGQAEPDAVVLFHVHGGHTLEALAPLAARLRDAGYVLSWDARRSTADAGPERDGGVNQRWRKVLDAADAGELPEVVSGADAGN
jgi:peptidoglycan-N-acetylglucosamine deacetylase